MLRLSFVQKQSQLKKKLLSC